MAPTLSVLIEKVLTSKLMNYWRDNRTRIRWEREKGLTGKVL